MKKYFFAFILFIISLFFINNAYALTISNWGLSSDLLIPQNISVFDCSTTNCNVDLNASAYFVNNSDNAYFENYTATSMSSGGAGVMWAFQVEPNLKSGYLYSMNIYVCHDSNNDLVYRGTYANTTMSGTTNLSNTVNVYSSISQSNLSGVPYPSILFNKCGFINTIFSPKNNSKFVGINYGLNGSASGYHSSFMGYNLTALGNASNLSSSDIQNVINNSGLATASDISSVNSSINNIQSSISSAESNIINNQNQNRQAIIDNQNENTDREIESQQVCNFIDKSNVGSDYMYISNSNGILASSANHIVTPFISIDKDTKIKVVDSFSSSTFYYCFYNVNKTVISCSNFSTLTSDSYLSIPSGSSYFRSTISKASNKPTFNICRNGNQAMNDSINNVNDTLNNSDSSGATDDAGSFFSGFTTNTFGLTSIITSPLNLINSLTSKTCSPLTLQIPFVNQTMQLPCMSTIYQQHFGSFLTVYQTITFGIISYWVCIRIFALVKDFKNPDHDEIEVMDL